VKGEEGLFLNETLLDGAGEDLTRIPQSVILFYLQEKLHGAYKVQFNRHFTDCHSLFMSRYHCERETCNFKTNRITTMTVHYKKTSHAAGVDPKKKSHSLTAQIGYHRAGYQQFGYLRCRGKKN
jgi:hypothetical protein